MRHELNCDAAGVAHLPPATRSIDIDALVNFKEIGPGLSGELRRLAPFGQRNPEPTFAARDVRLAQPPRTVGNNHLRLTLVQKTHAAGAHRRPPSIVHRLSISAPRPTTSPNGMSVDVAYDLDLEGGAYGSWERFRLRDIATPAAR